MIRYRRLFVFHFLVLSISHFSVAGTTGNLSGKVTDISNNDPLPGVNILIVGSGRGGVTNTKGEFLISGVAPGRYSLRFSSVGYKTLEVKNISIDVDETTVYNAKLASEDIELEGVTVEGKRPLIDTRKTSSDQTFNRDKIEQLPNLKSVDDVLSLQAGVVKFGGQIFLRGGRANETKLIIDGVVVNDMSSTSTGTGDGDPNALLRNIYSGASSTSGGLSAEAISSVSTSASGLDAEFGNAQSGVINITTKSGAEKFSGTGQYRTDGIVGNDFKERYYSASLSGPEPITKYLLPALGIEIPGNLSFFMSGSFGQEDGAYSFTKNRFYNPLRRKVQFSGFLGSLLNNLGFRFTDKQRNEFAFNSKLTWNSGTSDQIVYSYKANALSRNPFTSGFSWRDRYDSSLTRTSIDDQQFLQWKHFFGQNTELRTYVSRQERDETNSVGNLTPDQYSRVTDFSLGGRAYYRDRNNDGFNDIGSAQSWLRSNIVVWNLKTAFESQVHQAHFLKTGFELYYEQIRSTDIIYPLSDFRTPIRNAQGEYPDLGLGRWVNYNTPSYGGIWIQDNVDFSGFSMKIGLRYDFYYLGRQVYDSAFVRKYESVVGAKAEWMDGNSTFFSQFTRGTLSPRLAISYPITERASFYFNYNHSRQYPDRRNLFRDAYFDSSRQLTSAENFVGNPSLKPQLNIQYEAGYKQLVFEDLSLQLTGFYKDIFNYPSGQTLIVQGRRLSRNITLDYASVRGFEVIIEKGLSDYYSGSINYTYSLAKGRASDDRIVQIQEGNIGLPREVRLDWDRTHVLNLFVGYRLRPNEYVSVFGIPIDNFSASLTWALSSGTPYTPYSELAAGNLSRQYLANTKTGPMISEVNLSVSKGFNFFNTLNLLLTLDIKNLLNRRNVNLASGGFDSFTGAPYVFGNFDPATRNDEIYSWAAEAGGRAFDSRFPPFTFENPRQILLGMKLVWN